MSSLLSDYRENGRADTAPQASLEDLWACYRLLLGREPDIQGFDAYAHIIDRGLPVGELTHMFLSSPEFAARVQSAPSPSVERVALEDGDLFIPAFDAVVGEAILSTGRYEPHVTQAMSAVLAPGQTVVDIGANIGWFTFLASDRVGPEGRVIAFEPLARNVRLLVANQALRQAANVTILPFGASDREGIISLMAMGSIASSRHATLEDAITVNTLELAYARRVDDVVDQADILKIDIDGFDAFAIRGAERVLGDCSHVFAEFGPASLRQLSDIEPEAYLAAYADQGFNQFTVLAHDGSREDFGLDLARLAKEPEVRGLTHVDLHISRA